MIWIDGCIKYLSIKNESIETWMESFMQSQITKTEIRNNRAQFIAANEKFSSKE